MELYSDMNLNRVIVAGLALFAIGVTWMVLLARQAISTLEHDAAIKMSQLRDTPPSGTPDFGLYVSETRVVHQPLPRWLAIIGFTAFLCAAILKSILRWRADHNAGTS